MAEASGAKKGPIAIIVGPDTIEKANIYRLLGIWLTIIFSLATVASALLLKTVSLPIFIFLALGGFLTFVAGEIRRRLTIHNALTSLQSELDDLKAKLT